MTHSYVWHDSFIYATWLIHICDKTHSYVWHDSLIYAIWLIHMCDMTHSYMRHDSFICVTRFIHMCDTWLNRIKDLTCSFVGFISFIWGKWLTATHCNTLQHTATHLYHTADLFVWGNYSLQHTATHCNTLQHTATHLYHTADLFILGNDSSIRVVWLVNICDVTQAVYSRW